ncbi:MAG TPA: hypothetical protein VGB77_22260 [Abditibacteriaceae bacterium]|jgi:hypothetical protein
MSDLQDQSTQNTEEGTAVKRAESRIRRLDSYAQWTSVVLAVFSLLSAFAVFWLNDAPKDTYQSPKAYSIVQVRQLERDLEKIKQDLKQIKGNIAYLTQVSKKDKTQLPLQATNRSITQLQSKISRLEQVIMNSPTKAIELPLMRKDLDSLKEKSEADLVVVRQEVDRVYDQNKWFVGLIFTMALAVLSLVVGNFLKKDQEKKG